MGAPYQAPPSRERSCAPAATRDERLALAIAVAIPDERAQYLIGGGSGRKLADGYVAIVDAVDSGRPFMVRVATDILAIDADNDTEVEALSVLEREIRIAGGHPVVLMSGRDGGRHLFVRTGFAGWWRWERRARELRLYVREWIRPPLAPHPAGRRVGLVGLTVQESLDALDGARRGVLPLSEFTENLLAGRGLERYTSRSEALQAIATAMFGGRWPKEQFRQSVMASSFWRPVVKEHGGTEWLNRSWRSAETYVCAQRARDAAKVAQVRAAFDGADWSGPGRRTQRLIMEAHLRKAEWRGWSRHTFPRGDLAAEVGMNERSITRLWSALVDGGWLKRGQGGGGNQAVTWTVAVPPTAQDVDWASHGLDRAALAAGKLGKRQQQIQANIDARLERRGPSSWEDVPRAPDPYWAEVAPFVRDPDDPGKATHAGTGEVVLVEDLLAGHYRDEQPGIPGRYDGDDAEPVREDTLVNFEDVEEEEERWLRSS